MQLNSVVFPAPDCSYSIKDFPGEMIYIPRNYSPGCNKKKTTKIKKTKSQGQFQTKQDLKMSRNNSLYFDEYISDQKNSTLKSVKSSGDGFESNNKLSDNNGIESDHVPCLFLPYYSHKNQLQNQNKSLVESEIHQLNLKQWEQNKYKDDFHHQIHNQNMSTWLQDVINHLQKRKHSKIMIFFHGNAEDIGIARTTLMQLKKALRISILAVEYSGYGLFVGEKSADKVLSDCLSIYDYVNVEMNVAEEDIILFGRSLGSSPSCYIAKERPRVGSMILMSPFKSLREVAKDRVGKLLSYLLAERYRNIDLIAHCKCPVLIIHGMQDSIISVSHSQKLKSSCGSQICKLVTPYDMDHNKFQLSEDVITPIKLFFRENNIKLHKTNERTQSFKLSINLYYVPKAIFDYDFKLKQQKQKFEINQSITKSDVTYMKKGSKSMHNQTQINNSQQVTLNCNLEENITQPVIQNKNNMFKSFKSNSIDNVQEIATNIINSNKNINAAQLHRWKFQKSKSGHKTSRNNEQFRPIANQYDYRQHGGMLAGFEDGKLNGLQYKEEKGRQNNVHMKNRDTNETTYDANVRSIKKFQIPEEHKENISSIPNQNQHGGDDEFNSEMLINFFKNSEQKHSQNTCKQKYSNPHIKSPGTEENQKQQILKIQECEKMQNCDHQKQIWKTQITQMNNNNKSQEKITIPDININRYNIDYIDQQKTESMSPRKTHNQQTPNKFVLQNTRSEGRPSESFNLSPQSVKQSLPPETSNEGATTIKNVSQQNSNARSMASQKMSQKHLQRRALRRQKKSEKFKQYNYFIQQNHNDQNHSYIDLLNEKETEQNQPNTQEKCGKVENDNNQKEENGRVSMCNNELVQNPEIHPYQDAEIEQLQSLGPTCPRDFNSGRQSMPEEPEDSEENQDEIYPIYQNIHHPNYPTAQTEFNQYVVSTSEQNDYLYEQLTRKNNLIFLNRIQPENFGATDNGVEDGIMSSQISFNELEDQIEDLDLENKNDSLHESLQKQRKFEQLELNVTHQYTNYYLTSMKTLQTQQSKMMEVDNSCLAHNCDENLSHEIQVNNMNIKKIGKLINPMHPVQYRTQKHTQNSSRDFGNHSRVGSNNVFKKIRAEQQYHQATRSSIGQQRAQNVEMCRRVFSHGRFMSLPCNQLAAIQKIKDKKLASPVKRQIYKGDNNDDIPQQMTDERQNQKTVVDLKSVRSTLYGTQTQMSENFITSHYQSGQFLKPYDINFAKRPDRKSLKTYQKNQKNLNNYNKQQNQEVAKKYASCNLLLKHKKLTQDQKVRQNVLNEEYSMNQDVLQEQSNEEENSQNSLNSRQSLSDGLSLDQVECDVQMTQKSNTNNAKNIGNSNRKQYNIINLTHASNMQTSNMQTMITTNITREKTGPGIINQTTGTGFVTAVETQTQQDHVEPSNDQGHLGKITYRDQKEVIRKNEHKYNNKIKLMRKQIASNNFGLIRKSDLSQAQREDLNQELQDYQGNANDAYDRQINKDNETLEFEPFQNHGILYNMSLQQANKKQAKSCENQSKRHSIVGCAGIFRCGNKRNKESNPQEKYIETEVDKMRSEQRQLEKKAKKRKSSWWSCFRANY